MITDAELFELETLLIDKYENHVFDKIFFNGITTEIIASSRDVEQLLSINYHDRYKVFKSKVIISVPIFNLIRMRYFPRNKTVKIRILKVINDE